MPLMKLNRCPEVDPLMIKYSFVTAKSHKIILLGILQFLYYEDLNKKLLALSNICTYFNQINVILKLKTQQKVTY